MHKSMDQQYTCRQLPTHYRGLRSTVGAPKLRATPIKRYNLALFRRWRRLRSSRLRKNFCPRYLDHETYFPAKQTQARPSTWFSRTHGHALRTRDHQFAPRPRQKAPVGLTGLSDRLSSRSPASAPSAPAIDCRRRAPDARIPGMNTAGLPRQARLLSGVEFKRVFDARQVESNRYFRIHWAVRPEPEHRPLPCSSGRARLGLAIAKRVARRAVDRNRIRRIARETFRRRRHSMPPVDFVVLAKPPAAEADSRTLKLALEQLWLRFESP